MLSNVAADIDTLDHDILEPDVFEHQNDNLLLTDFNDVYKSSPHLFPLVYGIVNLCFFPVMTVIFDNYKNVSDRWRIHIEACYMAILLLVILLCYLKVAGIFVIIFYALADGLVLCSANRPLPFGLSEKFPFLS